MSMDLKKSAYYGHSESNQEKTLGRVGGIKAGEYGKFFCG